jgi:hypothetical protein
VHDGAVACSPAARRRLASGKVLLVSSRGHREGAGQDGRGGAHPSGGAAWRWWKMLRAAAFNGSEAASMTDDVDNAALQCQGRREKVRGKSIWTKRERAVVLTDNGGWRRCSGENQRGEGISHCGSRQVGRVGGGEGEDLKLECGRGAE